MRGRVSMCGRPLLRRRESDAAQPVQSCVRPACAALMAAGPDELDGGPELKQLTAPRARSAAPKEASRTGKLPPASCDSSPISALERACAAATVLRRLSTATGPRPRLTR